MYIFGWWKVFTPFIWIVVHVIFPFCSRSTRYANVLSTGKAFTFHLCIPSLCVSVLFLGTHKPTCHCCFIVVPTHVNIFMPVIRIQVCINFPVYQGSSY